MALTDTELKALKPQDKTYTVADEKGLYMEILPTGGKAWRYRYWFNGTQEKVSFGKYPALTLKNARRLRDEAASMVAMGVSPAAQKRQAKAAVEAEVKAPTTVAEFGERYFREDVARRWKNTTLPRRYFDKSIVPAIGNRPIVEITAGDVRDIIVRKKNEGFDAAAGQLRGVLKRMFDYAMLCGEVTTNPVGALSTRHVHRAQARQRSLSTKEIKIFLTAVGESNIRKQFKIALRLCLLTMVRKSELLLARWEHVDLDEGEWSIPAEHSKTGKPHLVYLSRQAAALFRSLAPLASGSELVLPGRASLKKPFAHNAINQALKTSMTGEDVPAFTVHDLRRTASTLLHEAGWAPDIVEKALNHNIGGTRGVYNRAAYAPQRREMLQAWADLVDKYVAAPDSVAPSSTVPT